MSLPVVVDHDLDERIVIFRVEDEVDVVAVITERLVALIDTTGTPEGCRTVLDALKGWLERRPLVVVNTHADWDHVWGNNALPGRALLVAHEAAVSRLRSPTDGLATLKAKRAQSDHFDQVTLVEPDVTFTDSLTLHGGDLTLELLHTPGHTTDHVAIWVPELRLCIAGDTAEDPIPEVTEPTAQNFELLRESLLLLRSLGPRQVIPAHGGTTSAEILDRNIAYLDAVAQRVAQLPSSAVASEDVEGLTFETCVAPTRELTAREVDFYRASHRKAIAAAASR